MVLVPQSKPQTTTHHKKRIGEHHKHSAHYGKPYWPYLPLVAIVGIGLVLNTIWAHHPGVLGLSTNISDNALLSETNLQRTNNAEQALTLNTELDNAAQAKANDMAKRNYWSHDTPDGRTPWSFITAAGYDYQAAGENLAYGFSSSDAVITGWMNSPEHRANVLGRSYTNVGFGVANSPDYQGTGPETVIVAMYAEPVTVTTANSHATTASAPSEIGVTLPSRTAGSQPSSQRISRIQVLTAGSAPWSVFVISTITTLVVLWFVIRHGLFWKRVVVKSEAFVVRHRVLDVVIISVATLGILLTRTAGFIH